MKYNIGMSQSKVPIPLDPEEQRRKRKESKKDALEIHKFLYLTQTVFPPRDVQEASTTQQYTLPQGEHVFNFSFVIPQTLACQSTKQPGSLSLSRFVIDSSGVDYAREASFHSSGTLPPSLSDMENVATIRYFLKATIARTSFLKMNVRVLKPFVFLPPDEPFPDDIKAGREIRFVRRNVVLRVDGREQQPAPASVSSKGKGKSKFKSWFSGGGSEFSSNDNGHTVPITFEMRYPGNASFVPVQPALPFKLCAILTESPENLMTTGGAMMFRDLAIKLFAITDTRAQEYSKSLTHCITLLDTHNLNVPLDWSTALHKRSPQYGESWEIELPSTIWEKTIIPDFVPPTFSMCNIKRRYTLEVIGGFSGTPGGAVQLVSLSPDITIKSGLVKKGDPVLPTRPGNQKASSSQNGDLPPPSYDTVVNQDEYGGGSASAAVAAASSEKHGVSSGDSERRHFGQAPGYYENMESFDTEKR